MKPKMLPIYGYPQYLISEDGVVWSIKNNRPISQYKTVSSDTTKRGEGYLRVELNKNGKGKKYFVHRLVAETFIDKPSPDATFVNHIDGNKSNNCVSNLEWVTHRQNVDHAVSTGLQPRGESIGTSLYSEDTIHDACRYIQQGNLSLQDISDITGLNYYTVSDLKNKRSWKHITSQYNYDCEQRLPRSRINRKIVG